MARRKLQTRESLEQVKARLVKEQADRTAQRIRQLLGDRTLFEGLSWCGSILAIGVGAALILSFLCLCGGDSNAVAPSNTMDKFSVSFHYY